MAKAIGSRTRRHANASKYYVDKQFQCLRRKPKTQPLEAAIVFFLAMLGPLGHLKLNALRERSRPRFARV